MSIWLLLLFAVWQGAGAPLTQDEVKKAIAEAGIKNDTLLNAVLRAEKEGASRRFRGDRNQRLQAAVVAAFEAERVWTMVSQVHASFPGGGGRVRTEAEYLKDVYEESLDSMGRLAVHSVPSGATVTVDGYLWNSPTDANGFAVAGTRTVSVDVGGQRVTVKCAVAKEKTSTVRIDFAKGTSVCEAPK